MSTPIAADIRKRIVDIIAEVACRDAALVEASNDLSSDAEVGLDSLDCIQIDMMLEDAFNIHIPDDEMAKVKTVVHAVEMVNRLSGRMNGGAA